MATRRQTSFAREHNIPLSRAKTILTDSAARGGGSVLSREVSRAGDSFRTAAGHLHAISTPAPWMIAGAEQLDAAADLLVDIAQLYSDYFARQTPRKPTKGRAPATKAPTPETTPQLEGSLPLAAAKAQEALAIVTADEVFTSYSGTMFTALATTLVEWLDRAISDTDKGTEVRDPHPPRILPAKADAMPADSMTDSDVDREWIQQWASDVQADRNLSETVRAGLAPISERMHRPRRDTDVRWPRVIVLLDAPNRGTKNALAKHFARLVAHFRSCPGEVATLHRQDLVGPHHGDASRTVHRKLTAATTRGIAHVDWDELPARAGRDTFGDEAAYAIADFLGSNPDAPLLITTKLLGTAFLDAFRIHPDLTLHHKPTTRPSDRGTP